MNRESIQFYLSYLIWCSLPCFEEGACVFALAQIENNIAGPTIIELMILCSQVAEQVGRDGGVLSLYAWWNSIHNSWRRRYKI